MPNTVQMQCWYTTLDSSPTPLPALPHLVRVRQDLLISNPPAPSVPCILLPALPHLVMLLQDLPEALLVEHQVVLSNE